MNRAERRRYAKKNKVSFKSLGKTDQPIDPTAATFCWNHKIVFENAQNPTERDKHLLDSIRFRPFKTTDRNGNIELGRSCPRCQNTVMVSKDRALLHSELEGYTTDEKIEGV